MSNHLPNVPTTHPLSLYREKYKLSYRQLAALLNLTRQTIYNYIQYLQYPAQHVKEQIATLTNQEIPVDCWPSTPSRKTRRLIKPSRNATVSSHPLELYRQKLGITYLALAAFLNLKYQTLYCYLSGKTYPSIKIKQSIALLTNQEIPVEAWPPSPKRKVGRPEGMGKSLKKRTS